MDEDVYKALEKWAQDEFRSVNGQIEWILREQLVAANRLRKGDNRPGEDTRAKAEPEA